MNITKYLRGLGMRARQAAQRLAHLPTADKNEVLLGIADHISTQQSAIINANEKDLQLAHKNQLESALIDRLALNPQRVTAMAEGLAQIAALADPIGAITDLGFRPSGIQVGRMTVPLGVIGVIYESRPNVTIDVAALCLKSGNAVILRGGSEALHSNQAITQCIHNILLEKLQLQDSVQLIETTDRAAVGALLKMSEYVDVIVPRGGKTLIERVSKEASIPVIKHLDGICHVYIDDDADINKAVKIALNAKTQRYGTCNTMECLLIADSVSDRVLEKLFPLYQKAGVEIRGCEKSIKFSKQIKLASDEDYATEYLAPILSLKIVKDMDEALIHIDKYGSKHTDAIVTENLGQARRFLTLVDSSSVMVNASTRFADGFEYGLGAELGISTDKFHARGPVGLEGLTSKKFIVIGDGHIRS